MEVDWDLHAVVRSCGRAATTENLASCFNWALPETSTASVEHYTNTVQLEDSFEFQFNEPRNEELHDLCRPFFFPKSQVALPTMASSSSPPTLTPPPPVSCSTALTPPVPSHLVEVKRQKQISKRNINSVLGVCNDSKAHHSVLRSKRRKPNPSKICHVPAEGVSSDTWSWRKYGQKPIKGSPYPRGYYRCSSSKRCPARKQVERNRSDPDMFIVAYTSEHNHPAPTHRNSLAGTTRHHNKPLLPSSSSSLSKTVILKQQSVSGSSGATTASDDDVDADPDVQQSTVAEDEDFDELIMGLGEDHNKDVMDIGLLDIALGDDFFDGLDEIAGDADNDGSSPCPRSAFSLPWLVNTNNAAAASAACST